MATVVKDFKVKSGLIVEGANATVGGFNVLKKANEQDEAYIIGLVSGGGGSSSDNTPETLVLRDENGNFAASDITVDELSIGSLGRIYKDEDDDLVIANIDDTDIEINANDLRLNATDDIRLEADDFIGITTLNGAIEFDAPNGDVFINGDAPEDKIVVRGTLNDIIGDNTVDGTLGNTITDRIATAVDDHSDLTTGVHGVTGDVVGTSDTQTLTNKTLGSGTNLSVNLDMNGNKIEDLGTPTAGTDATTKNYVDEADTATLGSANSYTDGRETAITTAYEAYADQAETDAIDSAASAAAALYAPLAGVTFTGDVILNGDPTQALGAATKGYVDAVAEGLHVHASVVAATTANVDLATGGLLEIDGVQLVADNRVLVKSQNDSEDNGIYLAKVGAWVRADDYDSSAEIQGGDFTFVTGGDTYASTGWVQVNVVTTLGTDPIEFDQFSGAGEYTAGTGLTLTGTSFAIDETYTATKSYVDGEITDLDTAAQGYANTAEDNAEAYTDSREAAITTAYQNYADTAEADAKIYTDEEIAALNTDDIEEGSANLYFTESRARNSLSGGTAIDYNSASGVIAIDASQLNTGDIAEGANQYYTDTRVKNVLTGSTQTNISITEVDGDLIITAENGVSDSTTDELDEGTTNLYFTDARAVSALEAIVPNFTEIDINDVATQVAASSTGDASQNVVAYQFATADYRSAKFLVKVAYGTHTEVSEVLVTLDTSDNVAITEYAIVGTNGSASAVSADVSGGNVRLLVTPTNNGSTIKVMGTLLV